MQDRISQSLKIISLDAGIVVAASALETGLTKMSQSPYDLQAPYNSLQTFSSYFSENSRMGITLAVTVLALYSTVELYKHYSSKRAFHNNRSKGLPDFSRTITNQNNSFMESLRS